jgi:hypothetical protein
LQSEKAIKEMRDKKATRDDIPVAAFKLLGKGGLELMTQLINNIYKNGQQTKQFAEVTMITLKKQKATKCSNHNTINLIAHASKIGARIVRKSLERKRKGDWRRSIWIQKRKRNKRCNRDAECVRMYFGHR